MITSEDVLPLLLEVCLSFSERWTEQRAFFGEGFLYGDLDEFMQHIVELHEAGQTEELPRVFEVLERFYLDGDDEVQAAITNVVLEGIRTTAKDTDEFIPYLQPESIKQWQQLENFWEDEIPLEENSLNEA
ncbi:hypothetical protein [Pseudanabaena sp. FACHB-2040]|uniref:DUF7674 family protein n=1 Tax=Pseudanabaena sp. FACHB-2040 TaxID=2692859 RepID=UPI001689D00E|nr:hypothetical protein [Pseudanabaena sp. FACHB-2040]MBD2257695.1 hypothetical protein [Pseudanabaena sp. FACHB-2040]